MIKVLIWGNEMKSNLALSLQKHEIFSYIYEQTCGHIRFPYQTSESLPVRIPALADLLICESHRRIKIWRVKNNGKKKKWGGDGRDALFYTYVGGACISCLKFSRLFYFILLVSIFYLFIFCDTQEMKKKCVSYRRSTCW